MLRRSVSLARYDPFFGVFTGGNSRARKSSNLHQADWAEMQNYIGRIVNVIANSGQCGGRPSRSGDSACHSSGRVSRHPRSASEGATPLGHQESSKNVRNEEFSDATKAASEIAELERQLDAARQRQRSAEVALMVKQRAAEREQEERRKREEEAVAAARKAAIDAERARREAAAEAESARQREAEMQAYREARMKEQEAKWRRRESEVQMDGLRADCAAAARRADAELQADASLGEAPRPGGERSGNTGTASFDNGSVRSGQRRGDNSAESDAHARHGPTVSMSRTEYAAAVRHYQLQRRMREQRAAGLGDWTSAGTDPTWHCRRQWNRCSDHASAFEPEGSQPVHSSAQNTMDGRAQDGVRGGRSAGAGAGLEKDAAPSGRSVEDATSEWLSQQAAAGARFFGVGRDDVERTGDSHSRSRSGVEARGAFDGTERRDSRGGRFGSIGTSAVARGQVISREEAEKRYADPSFSPLGRGGRGDGSGQRGGEERRDEGAEVQARRAMMGILRGGHSVTDGGRGSTFSPSSASVGESAHPQRTFERSSRVKDSTTSAAPRFVECEEDGVSGKVETASTPAPSARDSSGGGATSTRAERMERVERELREGAAAVNAHAGTSSSTPTPSAAAPSSTTTSYRTPSSFFTPSTTSSASGSPATTTSSSSSSSTSSATLSSSSTSRSTRAADEPVDALTFQQLVMRRLDAIDERLTSLSNTVSARGGRGGDAQ